MNRQEYDLVVVGGGPAGLAAAQEAYDNGVEDIALLERDFELGGILTQCIHHGFGLHYFGEELTGPEYAQQFIDNVRERDIDIKLNTMALEVTEDKVVYASNPDEGMMEFDAESVILTMGCRERTRDAIDIPGSRPAGVYMAGLAQRYTNIEGKIPGDEVVILGSGDIGLIMARRMHLEGADVKAVLEIQSHSGGLTRNIVQCLEDFDIPLRMQQTVSEIHGQDRVEAVTVTEVDDNFQPIPGTEYTIECDTVLLSVGLIPENELSEEAGIEMAARSGGPLVDDGRETSIDDIYACGNVLHVHDVVDWVTEESMIAGKTAAKKMQGEIKKRDQAIDTVPGQNVNYVVPHTIDNLDPDRKRIDAYFRPSEPMADVQVNLLADGEKLLDQSKQRVEPGEMETFPIPTQMINGSDVKELEIEIVEEGD